MARAGICTQRVFSYFSQSQLSSSLLHAGRKRGKSLPQWDLGPTMSGKALSRAGPRRAPNHAKHTSAAFFLIGSTVLSLQGSDRFAKEMGFSWPSHLKFVALSRAGGLPLYQQPSRFKEMLASTPQLGVSTCLKEARISHILRISCPRILEKCF